jgi:hypothetical protein
VGCEGRARVWAASSNDVITTAALIVCLPAKTDSVHLASWPGFDRRKTVLPEL